MSEREASSVPRKRVWVQNVAVGVRVLRARVEVARAQGLGPDQAAAADGVDVLLDRAEAAAYRVDPRPGRWSNWWRGTLFEAAYQNLHAARAQVVDVYDEAELAAEIPGAVARCHQTMHRDDPRRISAAELTKLPVASQRAVLRRLIEDGYDSLDRQHERVRSFRNIVLFSAMVITLLVTAASVVVWLNPEWMPLCFPQDTANGQAALSCPTGASVDSPQRPDIVVVALLGLLGGAFAAAVSIRSLRGTSTPYDVPVALAMLKVPLGAFTAIVGLVAIRGDFVPGLSALDSQEQILAYALLLGFAQQAFTRLLDRQAQTLLDSLPAKDAVTAPGPGPAETTVPPAPAEAAPSDGQAQPPPAPETLPSGPPAPVTAAPSPGTGVPAQGGEPTSDGVIGSVVTAVVPPETEPEPDFLPNPEGDEGDQEQDDDEPVLPDAPMRDHT